MVKNYRLFTEENLSVLYTLRYRFCSRMRINPFTPGTFTHDNPPIPWQFSVENKRTRAPKINHMRSKTRDKLWLSNKLFLLYELMGSQGM